MNRKYPTLLDRLLAHSIACPLTGCWIWTAHCSPKGYGRITIRKDGKPYGAWAHRVAYETFLGVKIARGMTLDHICNITGCINPAHLVEKTTAENTARAQAFRAAFRKRHNKTRSEEIAHVEER